MVALPIRRTPNHPGHPCLKEIGCPAIGVPLASVRVAVMVKGSLTVACDGTESVSTGGDGFNDGDDEVVAENVSVAITDAHFTFSVERDRAV